MAVKDKKTDKKSFFSLGGNDASGGTSESPPSKTSLSEKITGKDGLLMSVVKNVVWTMCFAFVMTSFIYLKTLSDGQLAMLFPTIDNQKTSQSGGGCGGKYNMKYDGSEWNPAPNLDEGLWNATWPGHKILNEWSTLGKAQRSGEAAWIWGPDFAPYNPGTWAKLTIIRSYNTLRGWLVSYLKMFSVTESQSYGNNMLIQSILLGLLGISPLLTFFVTLYHSVVVDPIIGLFGLILLYGSLLNSFITIIQGVQMSFTFFIPVMAYWVGNKYDTSKTMSKILACNIPTLSFIFIVRMLSSAGEIFEGPAVAGMWVAFIILLFLNSI